MNKEAIKRWIIPSIILFVLLAGFVIYFSARGLPSATPNSNLFIGSSPILGEKSAPVTIYEFSDFSCPYCEAVEGKHAQLEAYLKNRNPEWEAPLPKIKEDYVKSGKVKIVFKYFPGHGAAVVAHAVALGLYEQKPELFWAFAEKAFASPSDLNDLVKMKALAKELGADEKILNAYLDSGRYKTQLEEDTNMGLQNGVQGTPIFFINERIISGAQSFSEFQKIIDAELAK